MAILSRLLKRLKLVLAVHGEEALAFVDYITTNDVSKLEDGQAQYSLMCNPAGGIIDDLIVTRMGSAAGLVINAGNRKKDIAWIREQTEGFDAEVTDVSNQSALIAVQGPKAVDILAELTKDPIDKLGRFRAVSTFVAGLEAIVSRTGYTGEDGFELWLHDALGAPKVWSALLEAGEAEGIKPCGLAARDSLRLEAGLALYGHEIDETTNPYEAGLGWITKLEKGEFIGRQALRKIVEAPVTRKLTGLRMAARGRNPQSGHTIRHHGQIVSEVASGAYSPSLGLGITTAFLPTELAGQMGAEVDIDIRGKNASAQVTKLPFYKRQ